MYLSIALCTWNGEKFLAQQLDSLLAQHQLPDEVIVGDDGSEDATLQILERFANTARSRGIKVHITRNPERLGSRRNFEQTLLRCRGKLIFLCDQDDLWPEDKIVRMAAEFACHPELTLLASDGRLIDAQGNDLGLGLFAALEVRPWERQAMHAGHGYGVLLRRNIVTGATVALRHELLSLAMPFPDCWVHDEWLAIIASACGRVDTMDTALLGYRQHSSNQIGMRKRDLSEKFQSMRSLRRDFWQLVAQRTAVFVDHLGQLDDPSVEYPRRAALQKLRHARLRADLPKPRLARIRPVLREAGSGRYQRYSNGLRGIVRDLLRID